MGHQIISVDSVIIPTAQVLLCLILHSVLEFTAMEWSCLYTLRMRSVYPRGRHIKDMNINKKVTRGQSHAEHKDSELNKEGGLPTLCKSLKGDYI